MINALVLTFDQRLHPMRSLAALRLILLAFFLAWPGHCDLAYIVKKNDNLTSISRQYGIKPDRLAAYNGLKDKNKISIGQRLLIPSTKMDPLLHPALPNNLDKTKIKRRWKTIVIHHSGTTSGSVKGMDEYHRGTRHMENGLAYHFVIGNGRGMKDGEIAIGNRWMKQLHGGHLASEKQNESSIGICLVGNFDTGWVSRKQRESLTALVLYLMDRCKLDPDDVKTHSQINVVPTRCPGKHFPTGTFLKEIKEAS